MSKLMSPDFDMPSAACPECGYGVDAATVVFEKPKKPVAGDIAVCFNCGTPNVFAEDLTLRRPTSEEEADFPLEVARYQLEIRQSPWFRTLKKIDAKGGT
jgi:hypothetical protein